MRVKIACPSGEFVIELFVQQAPVTSSNFLAYVKQQFLDEAVIERVVTPENDTNPRCKIGVVQWGTRDPNKLLAPITHEPTSITGLSHTDGIVSMARPPDGTGQSLFFICVGDYPCLDHGGPRYKDQQGFAAFGQVVEGMEVIRAIYSTAEDNDYLKTSIPIQSVSLI